MAHCMSTASCLPLSIGRLRRHPRSHEPRNERYVFSVVMLRHILSSSNRLCSIFFSTRNATTSSRETQLQKYVSTPAIMSYVLNNPIPGPLNRHEHRSTILTTIHFSMYFTSFDRISSMWMNLEILCGTGSMDAGGTNWCKFAEGGGTSSLGQPLTCVSASFVQPARPWQTCWHIPLPFRSSSITMPEFVI
jgi:hypothetical protein